MYKVYEQIGNFSEVVFESDDWYEAQDYVENRFQESDCDDKELFFSYFSIEEEEEEILYCDRDPYVECYWGGCPYYGSCAHGVKEKEV